MKSAWRQFAAIMIRLKSWLKLLNTNDDDNNNRDDKQNLSGIILACNQVQQNTATVTC